MLHFLIVLLFAFLGEVAKALNDQEQVFVTEEMSCQETFLRSVPPVSLENYILNNDQLRPK